MRKREKTINLKKEKKVMKKLKRLDNEQIGEIYIDNPLIKSIDDPNFINQRGIINVITGQMALGKSYRTQIRINPHLFYNHDVDITILTAPNLEVLDYKLSVETWQRLNADRSNLTKVIVIDNGGSPAQAISSAVVYLEQGFKVFLLCSNQSFWSRSPGMTALKKVILDKKLTPALFVDEADKHTISCWQNYKNGKGWLAGSRKDYKATMFEAIMWFANISPFIFALTATPHAEMRGELPISNGRFKILNSPAPLDVIVPIMGAIRGINKFNAMFKGTQDNNINTYKYFLEKAVIAHLNRPGNKKCMLVKCKPANGNHGLSIHETRKIISNILISRGYDDTEHKIVVMTSENKTYYGPYGQFQQTYVDESECISRLNDFNDSLEFLLVVNKGQSGINVANLKTVFYITDKKSRDDDGNPVVEAIIQFLGRGSRFNPGVPLKEWNELNGRGISQDWIANATTQEKLNLMEENVLDVWVPDMDVWNKGLSEFIENYIPSITHLEKLLFEKK